MTVPKGLRYNFLGGGQVTIGAEGGQRTWI